MRRPNRGHVNAHLTTPPALSRRCGRAGRGKALSEALLADQPLLDFGGQSLERAAAAASQPDCRRLLVSRGRGVGLVAPAHQRAPGLLLELCGVGAADTRSAGVLREGRLAQGGGRALPASRGQRRRVSGARHAALRCSRPSRLLPACPSGRGAPGAPLLACEYDGLDGAARGVHGHDLHTVIRMHPLNCHHVVVRPHDTPSRGHFHRLPHGMSGGADERRGLQAGGPAISRAACAEVCVFRCCEQPLAPAGPLPMRTSSRMASPLGDGVARIGTRPRVSMHWRALCLQREGWEGRVSLRRTLCVLRTAWMSRVKASEHCAKV
jgi:hypothetical protein